MRSGSPLNFPCKTFSKGQIAQIYKSESGRILASLVRILGDFDLAEEALQEAFKVALEKWPIEGIPKNPYSWLISAGKFKAIDSIRRLGRERELLLENFPFNNEVYPEPQVWGKDVVEDDQLRLIFSVVIPHYLWIRELPFPLGMSAA